MLAVVAETTGRVDSERRLATLRDLAQSAATRATPTKPGQSRLARQQVGGVRHAGQQHQRRGSEAGA